MKFSDAMVGAKRNSSKSCYDKNSVEYREKRAKNNNAVKKSRDKSKQKSMEASARVKQLQVENENLRGTVENMQQELRYLKDMLINQAGASEYLSAASEADLEYLLRDDTIAGPEDLTKLSSILTEMKRIQLQNSRLEQEQDALSQYSRSVYDTSELYNQNSSGTY